MPLNSPILTGDVSGTIHGTTVDKIKGSTVSATTPANGQVLTWDGSQWTPATPSTGGGGGANGLTYYLDYGTAADLPTINLPGTPKMLGRTGSDQSTSVTSGSLMADTWELIVGFVSESTPQDPAVLVIPAGLWDFNIWALGNANNQAPSSIRAKVYTYNGYDVPTLIATSSQTVISTISTQYSISALIPQTNITATTRIYVEIEALATANGHTVTLQFGDGQPSHVHTSLPLVGGTGLWKNVSGVLQSPASLLVDADVDPAAAIAQSKISGLTTALDSKAAKSVVQVFGTAGTFTWTKPTTAFSHIVVELVSGGNGGGAGGKGASGTAVYGGSGGGAGGYSRTVIDAADLTESTYQVVVGAGGAGGQPGVAGQGGIVGAGFVGSNSSFAPNSTPTQFLARAQSGGTPGQPGGASAPTTGTGGAPNSNAGGTANITGTGGAGSGSANAPTGGGAGGGISTAPQAFNGGNGATNPFINTFSAGGGGSTVSSGGSATASITRTAASLIMNGSGGGGGGASIFANGSGGNGANGSGNGSGGGGGGATTGSGNGGNGGNGAKGIVVITTYF